MLRAAFPTCLLGSHSLSGHFLLDLESAHHRLLKTPERNHGPQWRLLTLKGVVVSLHCTGIWEERITRKETLCQCESQCNTKVCSDPSFVRLEI